MRPTSKHLRRDSSTWALSRGSRPPPCASRCTMRSRILHRPNGSTSPKFSFAGDGVLEILSWPGEVAFSVRTATGPLRLRAMWAGLEPGLAEGLPEGRPSAEHLEFQIWPAPSADRAVLRWWPEWDLPPPSAAAPDGRRQIEGVDEVVRLLQGGLRRVPVDFGWGSDAPVLPGGTSGSCHAIWGDPDEATWWVDGYDVRRTMRTATADEVRDLVRRAKPSKPGEIRLPAGPRWSTMLASIGVAESRR